MNKEQDIIRNLEDAGCDCQLIKQYLTYEAQGMKIEKQSLLQDYRKKLLSSLHNKQEQLYCLDYLIYQQRIMKGKSR